jgi:hypothetical protein
MGARAGKEAFTAKQQRGNLCANKAAKEGKEPVLGRGKKKREKLSAESLVLLWPAML